MKTKFYIAFICVLSYVRMHAQNSCNNPIQLCFSNNSSISFPATTAGTAQVGPAYGCLATQPAPTWFYIKTNAAITNSVTQFVISSSSNLDVDAILWGPSSSNTAFCSVISNSASIIGCSYSTASTETISIPNTLPNQYYIIMVTNYSSSAQNINITCTQGGNNISCPPGAPNADFSMPNSIICQGQSVPLTDLSVPSGSISSWNYNCPAASPPSSTFQNPTFTFNTPGTHTISLSVSSTGSLTSTITKTIQVNPAPVINVSPSNQTICAGKTATINLSGASSYNTVPSNITVPSFTVNPTATTIYTITGFNSFGCSSVIRDTVKVISPPTIFSSVNSNTVCFGNSVTFSNSGGASYTLSPSSFTGNIINITPSVVGTTVYTITGSGPFGCINTKTLSVATVSVPNVVITPSNTTICAGQVVSISVSGANTYTWTTGSSLNVISVTPTTSTTYSVIGSNSLGCQNSALSTINVLPTPILSINSPSTSVCFGYTMSINVNGAANYNWSNGSAANTISVQPFSNITYSVVGSNGGTCSDTAYLPITVLPLPSVSASVSSTIVCAGEAIDLTGSGNATTYYWQPNNLLGQSHIVQVFTPTTYTLYGQGSNGCAFFNTVFVDVYVSNPVIPISTPSLICLGDSSILSVGGGVVPAWNVNPSPNTIVVTPTVTTTYSANVLDFNGCSSNILFSVELDPNCEVLVYNGFTPNGDGINDYFIIGNIEKIPNNHVHIFNRWGNKIVSISNYNNLNNKWDGKENGEPLTSGTYFYLIVNENEKVLQKGWIELTN
jgi:gliding motility-associated-like protein